ncbi:MAG TPA: RluA family pseudouridine synthase [Firmicutes bacterium]|jgi:23S rRNA pseudouridine1911/1915/1917 synthase|nr:RluA family pseudouridine synthase [Bacillota bacterium]
MEKKIHIVKKSEEGMRLDHFLSAREPDLSRSFLQKLCTGGNVWVGEQLQRKCGYRVKENQSIKISIPPPEIITAKPEDLPLDIIYEDSDLLVVNKPSGMVVHPAPGHHSGTLVNALLSHCDVLFTLGDRIRPGIVHRLDKDTSGLLVVAKNEPSFRVLSAQIKARQMKREYLAIVHRLPPVDEGTIDLPLGRDYHNRKKIAVRKNGTGRRAVTHFKVLDKKGPFYLLSLRLETGRTHQIRVHLSYIGCPIVGDPLYGPKRSPYNKYGQFLHARTLGFKHPRSAEYLEFTVEPGEEFSDLLKYGGKI